MHNQSAKMRRENIAEEVFDIIVTKINDRHQTEDQEVSENTKKNKYQKYQTQIYHIQNSEKQIQREQLERGWLG